MVRIVNHALDQDAVRDLQRYFHTPDADLDVRPDVISKNPDPNSDVWPAHHVRRALDRILDRAYEIEEALFHKSWIRYHLHADTLKGLDQQRLYKVILFPLEFQGTAGTTFFNNHWTGASAKFTKAIYQHWQYDIPNRHGGTTEIQDIRALAEQAETDPDSLQADFVVDRSFKEMLLHLIEVRQNPQVKHREHVRLRRTWISDYSAVSGITDEPFSEYLREKYCAHIPAEDLVGLSLDCYVPWQLGSAIVFDRTQIHCGGNGDLGKLGLTVLTNWV